MKPITLFFLSAALSHGATEAPAANPVVPFSSWENLPAIIHSITEDDYRNQLEATVPRDDFAAFLIRWIKPAPSGM